MFVRRHSNSEFNIDFKKRRKTPIINNQMVIVKTIISEDWYNINLKILIQLNHCSNNWDVVD